jgi:aspartate aminotransferase
MFSFTGLNPQQTKRLVEEYSIYLTCACGSRTSTSHHKLTHFVPLANGRISMAGLNKNNVEIFAKAVDEVVRGK